MMRSSDGRLRNGNGVVGGAGVVGSCVVRGSILGAFRVRSLVFVLWSCRDKLPLIREV